MPFSIDFLDDGRVLEWEATADGAVATERDDYTPCFYVAPRNLDADLDLTTLQSVYDQHPDVVATETVARRPGFRRDEETVLAVDVDHIDRVTSLARQARQLSAYPIGDLTCFNVDFSREFRYCLENDLDPTPATELSTLRLSVPVTETSGETYTELSVAGDTATGAPEEILTAVQAALDIHDPDILVCSTSEIIPTLYEMATTAGVDETYTYCPNCGAIACTSHTKTERLEGEPVCTGCAVTERFALKTKYFYDEENLETFREDYADMPIHEKAMENKLLAGGSVVAALLVIIGLLVVGGVI